MKTIDVAIDYIVQHSSELYTVSSDKLDALDFLVTSALWDRADLTRVDEDTE